MPLFVRYKIVNKNNILKFIDEIYACVPVDVQEARKYLRVQKYDMDSFADKNKDISIYDILKELEIELDNSLIIFCRYIIVDSTKFEEILSKLENNLPEEILKAEISAK